MKAMILAGGLGSRLAEETSVRPKPLVNVGPYPILWHIMKIYRHHGIKEFIICLGYKGEMIREYFLNYSMHRSDITIDLSDNSVELHRQRSEDWRVTLVDTGDATMTGGRVKRASEYLDPSEDFLLTYGDGVGDTSILVGWEPNNLDCNDANVFVFPGAPEICNNIDDDCDGGIDDDALDAQIAYVDYDFDGWGAAAVATCAFTLPYGYTDLVLTPGDCDDFSPSVNPGTDELCNGIDDDCDGDVDDDDANVADPDLWYADEDDDGFGDYASPRFACDEPPGDWSLDGGDCAPADPDIHPDAPEVCNFVDDDCDDLVDDADPELPTCP